MKSPVVIKIGGSLSDHYERICHEITAAGRPVLVVPGGGRFADQVRAVDPPLDVAHWMAIAAMEQTGWLIHSAGIPWTCTLSRPGGPVIFLPYSTMRQLDPLPHSWDVTSDSVAAWVARTLDLPLVLAKPVDGISDGSGIISHLDHPVATDVVDPVFLGYSLMHGLRVNIINGAVPGRLRAFLEGEAVEGTGIGDLLSGHRMRL